MPYFRFDFKFSFTLLIVSGFIFFYSGEAALYKTTKQFYKVFEEL